MSTLTLAPGLERFIDLFDLAERTDDYSDLPFADLWSGSGVSPSISTQDQGYGRVNSALEQLLGHIDIDEVDAWCDYPYRIVWRIPDLRAHVTYCEGDVSLLIARTDADYEQINQSAREFYDADEREPEPTYCGGGRQAMLAGCQCDGCLWAGDDEYHRRKDEGSL